LLLPSPTELAAILAEHHWPGFSAGAVTFVDGQRGTQGAVIGYPGGGPEAVEPAVIDAAVNAQGRDIYNSNLVTREVYVLQSTVRPGNSGGPLVDTQGHVLGIVFATSAAQAGQAFALTSEQISAAITAGRESHSVIATQTYACAA